MVKSFFTGIATSCLLISTSALTAQTVTVAASGGQYSTVQAAIDSFSADTVLTDNVIQITDSSVYDEAITVNVPVTIVGTQTAKPVLAVQANSAGRGSSAGLVVNLPASLTTGTVILRNLTVIPSAAATPQSCAINVFNNNAFVFLDDVLVSANNGAGQPVSTDGLTDPAITGSEINFGEDGIVAGETDAGQFAGDGVELLLRNTIVTQLRGTASTYNYCVQLANDSITPAYRMLHIMDGCVFSYSTNGYGIVVTGDCMIDSPAERTLITGVRYGIFFNGDSPNTRLVRGVNIVSNSYAGIYESSSTGVRMTMEDSIVANNSRQSIWILGTLDSPVTIRRSTVARNTNLTYNAMRIEPDSPMEVNIEDSIIAGNGSGRAANCIWNETSGTINLVNSAIVTNGPLSLVNDGLLISETLSGPPAATSYPNFVNIYDVTSPDFYAVLSPDYATAGSGGAPLAGGSVFVGYTGSVTEQIISVAKTGGDFNTIQGALDSLILDESKRYVIEITDSGTYDETITMDVPATIIGTGSARPILAVQENAAGFDSAGVNAATNWSGNGGLTIAIPDSVSTCSVGLKNLVIIPSRNGTPAASGITSVNNNFYLEMDNVLVTSNDGADAPVSTDGTADLGTVNTSFGVFGVYLGSITNGRIEKAGAEVYMTDCIVTNIKGAAGATYRAAMYMCRTYYIDLNAPEPKPSTNLNAYRYLHIGDGCLFSYNNGTAIRTAASLDVDAPLNRLKLIGQGDSGLWMDMVRGRNNVNGLISSFNILMGVNEGVGNDGPRMNMTNAIVSDNGWYGLYHRLGTVVQVSSRVSDSTIANNSIGRTDLNQIQTSDGKASFTVVMKDSIIAGNGLTGEFRNAVGLNSTGRYTINHVAAVTEGLMAMYDPWYYIAGTTPRVFEEPVTKLDPLFKNTIDPFAVDFYDVQSPVYATLASNGGPLDGGANFSVSSTVRDWSAY